MTELRVARHPSLLLGAFVTRFPAPLGDAGEAGEAGEDGGDGREGASPPWLAALLRDGAEGAPLARDEDVRRRIRDLLRHGGYKPTGRGKPASEYLVRAAAEGALAPINTAVDACNAVSLASGLPISVVDLDRAAPPFSVDLAPPGARYVFNPSGQEIDLAGLVCLFDAEGPCANAVRDAQRTKTGPATRATLSLVWGAAGLEERLDTAVRWYRELLERTGAETAEVGRGGPA